MHTTASDGRLSPAELVARAAAAGLTTISVTDHDTVAAIESVTAAAAPRGIRVIPGIEVTAVDNHRDVHMLAYFIDPANEPLADLLVKQRALRVARVTEIADRLATLNVPVDVDNLLLMAAAHPGSSVGRPQLARELVRAGHVQSVQEAFDKWLATGRPGFVPRTGPSPADVIETDPRRRRRRVVRASGRDQSRRFDRVARRPRPGCDRGVSLGSHAGTGHGLQGPGDAPQPARQRRIGFSRRRSASQGSASVRIGPTLGVITLPPEALAALEATARRRSSHRRVAASSLRRVMGPLLEVRGLVKDYQALRPLRIRELIVEPGAVLSIAGLDAAGRGNVRPPGHRRDVAG